MSLSSQIGLLATRIGTEIKSVRNSFVPNALRGPIGGVTESAGVQGTVNLDPALSNQRRLIATGDVTIAAMGAGSDGQRILLEINASGGQRVITFDSSYELSNAVTTRTFTIPSGSWAYIALIYRANGTTWRLVSAEPQVVPVGTPPSMWLPSDHGLLAWTVDPANIDFAVGNSNGSLVGSSIKVSTTGLCTTVTYGVNTAGAGFTANRNYIGMYDSNNNLVAQTADLATTWSTTGVKNTAWTSAVTITPGTYYVGFICTATTTTPIFAAGSNGFGTVARGRTAMGWRGSGETVTGRTALPTTRPAPGGNNNAMWFGLA